MELDIMMDKTNAIILGPEDLISMSAYKPIDEINCTDFQQFAMTSDKIVEINRAIQCNDIVLFIDDRTSRLDTKIIKSRWGCTGTVKQ